MIGQIVGGQIVMGNDSGAKRILVFAEDRLEFNVSTPKGRVKQRVYPCRALSADAGTRKVTTLVRQSLLDGFRFESVDFPNPMFVAAVLATAKGMSKEVVGTTLAKFMEDPAAFQFVDTSEGVELCMVSIHKAPDPDAKRLFNTHLAAALLVDRNASVVTSSGWLSGCSLAAANDGDLTPHQRDQLIAACGFSLLTVSF